MRGYVVATQKAAAEAQRAATRAQGHALGAQQAAAEAQKAATAAQKAATEAQERQARFDATRPDLVRPMMVPPGWLHRVPLGRLIGRVA